MKNAERVYFALLRLYPHGYRKAFGKEMLQTFRDYYADVERTDGRVSAAFWLGLLADESKNLVEQHWRAVGENKMALKHVGAKAALFTVLVIPLYFLCSSAYVRILFLIPG